ncbi:hypothetical protein VITU102760_17830 [Vibrio tubiashii]|uniref:SD-repeat containing protein B domain-containing protein n=1 Tax=Vibrio tubiashii ATCC 19109 TaxID=1051646 RepID=F9SZG2_9VIBR|nr:hypothetical protein [Vibrio tubiashii]AIW12945.1 hypothetical protein IX91_01795 [Vibrio tubiashii ATCC 19109]EGU59142.1 hypothetical protein VITU9109_25455 [Vibrio tubiashii ATCC 19109]EIF03368.1 hypothetical protein VT1337_13887 [Vibrio tubiashii NCIMB 1337 = ATCC 19106]
MKKSTLLLLASAALPSLAFAHTPLFSCYDFGDNTILCEGGFSDGSSAAGVEILVVDGSGTELIKSEINEDGEIEFNKPQGAYKVLFNAGPGHSIEVDGKDIVE